MGAVTAAEAATATAIRSVVEVWTEGSAATARAARERLVEDHLMLVRHIVVQVSAGFPRHVDREELVRAGTLGLVEAAARFDASRGVPFDQFVSQRIRGAVLDAVRRADWTPRSVRRVARDADAAEQRLAASLGRVPTRSELAAEMGVTEDELRRLHERLSRSVVLALEAGSAGDSDDEPALSEVLCDRTASGPDEVLENRELAAYLRDAVDLLPDRHRMIVVGYFFEGRTSEELARLLGVTESRISQLRSDAIDRLREGIEAQYAWDTAPTAVRQGRAARSRASYAAAIADASSWQVRLSEVAPVAVARSA